MIDIITNKLRDYLHSNNVYWQINNELFIVIAESETIRLAFKICNNQITLKTSLDNSLAFEPAIAKFNTVKIRVQNFILENEKIINEIIVIHKNLILLEGK